MEKTYLRRHGVRPTCLAYRDKVRRAKVKQEKLTQKEKAQPQGFKCPHRGYDYGPFARPFFEGAKRGHLRRMRRMLRGVRHEKGRFHLLNQFSMTVAGIEASASPSSMGIRS